MPSSLSSTTVYDVVVVGGGAAGVGAAVGAAQAGASCLLIESGPCLGGAATQKNVLTYCGLYTQADDCRLAVGGVAKAVLEELRRLGGVASPVRLPPPSNHVIAVLDPEAVKLALDRVTSAAKVQLLLHTTVVAAERKESAISAVTLQDHRGTSQVRSRTFVDASGEGDLSALGGASVRYGNHGKAQAGSLGVRFGGALPNHFSVQTFREAIQRAKQAGSALLNKDHGLLLRLPISDDSIAYYIDACYDALDSASLTNAEIEGREKAWAYLQTARTIEGCEGMYITSTGPQFGTRESRHINSERALTQDDVVQGTKFDDVVALGAWPVEYHGSENAPTVWKDVKDQQTFEIPLRALHSLDTRNLFACGRLADGDSGAGGAIRVMGTSFATGQASGVAAAMLAQGVEDTRRVQSELRRQGAFLDSDTLPSVHPVTVQN